MCQASRSSCQHCLHVHCLIESAEIQCYCPKKYGIHWSQNLHSVHRCAFCSLYDVFHLYRLLNANLMGLWVKILGSMCRCHACNKAGAMAEKCSQGCVSPQTWHWHFSSNDSPMCFSCCLLRRLRVLTFWMIVELVIINP